MSDDQEFQDDELENGEDESFVRLSKKDVQQLRRAAKKSNDEVVELEKLRKERVFLKAGVDVDTPLGQLLFNGYSGDLDVESVKAQAIEVGALHSEVPQADVLTPSDEERRLTDERRELANGSEPDRFKIEDKDPKTLGLEKANEALASGRTQEDALGIMFETLITAAQQGDTRVLWDPAAS